MTCWGIPSLTAWCWIDGYPIGDGLSLVAHLRAHGDETPIIMLTTMDKNDQRIEGLRTGADDYLGKPFTMEELALRLHKLLGRRARTTLLEAGPIKIDPLGHRTWVRDEEIELTAKEFDLVSLLLSNQGRVLTTAQLLQRVWGLQHDPGTNRVAVYINRVRTKIGPGLIHTVRSIGYVFDPNR